jgi:pimeloyl-ACP methyl ester carboxylesterase
MRLKHLKESWVSINENPVFFRESREPFPSGSKTLIHLHGMGMSGTYMAPAADGLAAEYRSYVPDLPGFGRSAKTGTPPTIEGLAQSTIDFMDALGIDKATLIGNSMGCMTIMEFVYRCPERIEAAILCSPGQPVYQPLARGIWQVARIPVREPIGLIPIVIHDYVRCGVRDGMRLYRSMVGYPTWSRFLRLSAPTLMVHGGKDPLLTRAKVNRQSALRGKIQVLTIPGAGHAMNYSHPGETAAAIRTFLQGRAGSECEFAGPAPIDFASIDRSG